MFSIITLCFTVRNVVSCGHSGRSINDEDDDAHEDDFVQEEEDGDDNDNDVQEVLGEREETRPSSRATPGQPPRR